MACHSLMFISLQGSLRVTKLLAQLLNIQGKVLEDFAFEQSKSETTQALLDMALLSKFQEHSHHASPFCLAAYH